MQEPSGRHPRNEKAPGAGTAGASENVIKLELDHMQNTSRAFTPQQQAPVYSTPEEAMQAKPIGSLDEVEDAISCVICRSDGLIALLMDAVEDESVSRAVLVNVLWALQGQMEQARLLMNGRIEGRAAA